MLDQPFQNSRNESSGRVVEAISQAVETRGVEYKRSEPFESLKWKIVKTSMAMANLRGGGVIVIGVAEHDEGAYDLVGMTSEHLTTYNQDTIYNLVNKYARPAISLRVRSVSVDNKDFIGIEIDQFERTPVICSVAMPNEASRDLVRVGQIVGRSRERIATSVVGDPDVVDEILNLGMEIRASEFLAAANRLGLGPNPTSSAFREERNDFFGDE